MSVAVATFKYTRGETIQWWIYGTPDYDGSEVITSGLKKAINGSAVPPDEAPVIASPEAVFVAASGDVRAHWLFTITAADSGLMDSGDYITDAKEVYQDGFIEKLDPLGIKVDRRVGQ